MNGASAGLDDVEFLLRSSNRLDVLAAIRETPRTRRELRTETDFSRVTLSRILGDLTDRGWIVRRDGHYEPTPAGIVVWGEVGRLTDNLEALDVLGETLDWLPVERFDFELRRLADAEVMLPDEHDLTAQLRWVDGRIREAERLRTVATWVTPEVLASVVDSTVHGGGSFECVMEGDIVAHVRGDPELREPVQRLVECDGVAFFRYDGDDADMTMSILEDGVLMCGQHDPLSFPEAVATTDDAVLEWAIERFESLRADSTRLDVEAFTP